MQPIGSEEVGISTDGGRYDVNMAARQRIPVYWEGLASAIRRCSWFYRSHNDIMQPFNEEQANILEVGAGSQSLITCTVLSYTILAASALLINLRQ